MPASLHFRCHAAQASAQPRLLYAEIGNELRRNGLNSVSSADGCVDAAQTLCAVAALSASPNPARTPIRAAAAQFLLDGICGHAATSPRRAGARLPSGGISMHGRCALIDIFEQLERRERTALTRTEPRNKYGLVCRPKFQVDRKMKTAMNTVSEPSTRRYSIKSRRRTIFVGSHERLSHRLANELRRETIEAVSVTGGHLGAGLGVVELTVALHYVFNTPDDRLIWDVGHQAYPHKILTGRRDRIQNAPPAGRPLRIHQAHRKSVSIPSARRIRRRRSRLDLGMCVARDLKGDSNNVICVIGDGAMSAGMAYEAMNNAGAQDARLIVSSTITICRLRRRPELCRAI